MIVKFEDLFDSFRGANSKKMPELTEEIIYKFCNFSENFKRIPVFSATDSERKISGVVPNFLDKKDLDGTQEKFIEKNGIRYFINNSGCLTMIRCGNAGKIFYRSEEDYPLFSLTTSIFTFFLKNDKEIKEKHPDFDGLNLRWFSIKFNPLFNNLVKGDGLSTIPLSIINKVELEIPCKRIQDEEESLYKRILKIRNTLGDLLDKSISLLGRNLGMPDKFEGMEEIPVSDIFDFTSGNSGLTEEFIYSRMNFGGEEKYNVLSSSTIDRTYMGEISECKLPNGKDLKIFKDKEGVLVIRNGKAGKLIYLYNGNYTLNDHAYILSLNRSYGKRILLNWLIYQYQYLFYEFSSSSDNGTWNKTSFMENGRIKIIPEKNQLEIINSYSNLNTIINKLKTINSNINLIFEKELVSE